MNDNKSIGWEEIVRRNCYIRPATAEDGADLAREAIEAVRAEITAAEERGKAYWEPSDYHKDIWRKEGRAVALKEMREIAMKNAEAYKGKRLGDGNEFVLLFLKDYAALSPKDITSKKE